MGQVLEVLCGVSESTRLAIPVGSQRAQMKGTWAAWGLSWPCSLAMVATSSARHCADAPGWDLKKPRQLHSTQGQSRLAWVRKLCLQAAVGPHVQVLSGQLRWQHGTALEQGS